MTLAYNSRLSRLAMYYLFADKKELVRLFSDIYIYRSMYFPHGKNVRRKFYVFIYGS